MVMGCILEDLLPLTVELTLCAGRLRCPCYHFVLKQLAFLYSIEHASCLACI
jgi:hypothetical protein